MNPKENLPKSPFPHWASFVLVSRFRRRRLNPIKIIASASVKEGQTVLELGCGPGFFTEFIAKKVGPQGKVIAQDVQRQMLAKLRKRMARFPTSDNIEPLLASSSSLGLPSESIDLIFAANVFEEIVKEGEFPATAMELRRVLKTNGVLFIGEHRVAASLLQSVFEDLEKAGFKPADGGDDSFFYSAVYKLNSGEKDET